MNAEMRDAIWAGEMREAVERELARQTMRRERNEARARLIAVVQELRALGVNEAAIQRAVKEA